MDAYQFSRARKQFARGELSGSWDVMSAFGWFRTDTPQVEQYFLCLGDAKSGIRAVGVRSGQVTAVTGYYGRFTRASDTDRRVKVGEWIWVCSIWEEGNLRLYVGMREVWDGAVLAVSSSVWWMGCMGGFVGANYFTGDLARWGWVPRALSEDEIRDLANGDERPRDAQPTVMVSSERAAMPVMDEAPVLVRQRNLPPATGARKHARRMG